MPPARGLARWARWPRRRGPLPTDRPGMVRIGDDFASHEVKGVEAGQRRSREQEACIRAADDPIGNQGTIVDQQGAVDDEIPGVALDAILSETRQTHLE